MVDKKLLEHRKKSKKAKPHFIRQQALHTKRLGKIWRRPRGVQSKLRLQKRGKPKKVKIGYKSPNKVRGLTREGLEMAIVNNIKELREHQKKLIILATGIGSRKRATLLKEAKKLNIQFADIKDIDKELEKIHSKFKVRKDLKRKKAEEKKEKEKKKKAEKKKGVAEAKKQEGIKEKVAKAKEDAIKKKEEKKEAKEEKKEAKEEKKEAKKETKKEIKKND